MARCICCGRRVCTRETNFYPELGGFICFECERDEEIIQRREQEVKYMLNNKINEKWDA